jgi:hypothetical protein
VLSWLGLLPNTVRLSAVSRAHGASVATHLMITKQPEVRFEADPKNTNPCLLAVQVVMTIVAISSTLNYMPTDPDDPEPPVLQAKPHCLQLLQNKSQSTHSAAICFQVPKLVPIVASLPCRLGCRTLHGRRRSTAGGWPSGGCR